MKDIFEIFYPDIKVKSAYTIDYTRLFDAGYLGLVYDIDNTLVEHGAPANDASRKLFKTLHEIGFKTCLISNNTEKRVKPFAEEVESYYIHKADKPSPKGYLKCCEAMGLEKDRVILIGDQIFTDIWGANRAGIKNILVGKIGPKEEIQIYFKRILEAVVLYFYKRRKNKAK